MKDLSFPFLCQIYLSSEGKTQLKVTPNHENKQHITKHCMNKISNYFTSFILT